MKKSVFFSLACLGLWLQLPAWGQEIEYKVSFLKAQTHYMDVEMRISRFKDNKLTLKMPVWAPGSYLVREFSRNVEGESATDGNNNLPVTKTDKSTWVIDPGKSNTVVFKYRVYAFEHSVRTSFVDASHALINGTSVFAYLDGHLDKPSTVTIEPYAGWQQISTGLEQVGGDKWKRSAENYDILADSPFEIGNHEIYPFTAAGISHELAVYGGGNFNRSKTIADMIKIIDAAGKVFGENPCKRYVFILNSMAGARGGLEHLNSTAIIYNRFGYGSPQGYKDFLSLVSHEYFHLWNVKRLRPDVLGPFDYDKENYTRLLWVSEGITSYYDDLLVQRAGIYSTDEYAGVLQRNINSFESVPGKDIQSATESSFDAWIKQYRPDENSHNAGVSYYTKGAVLGPLLDLAIINETEGKKSLDDVMKYMYEEYYKDKNRGFTEEEFQKAVEKAAGTKMDDFFKDYVYGTKPLDYAKYLGYAGLKADAITDTRAYMGADVSDDGGKLIVKRVYRDTPAWNYGLNAKDEIIAVDGNRTNAAFYNAYIASKKPGEVVKVLISRNDQILSLDITLDVSKRVSYQISSVEKPDKKQKKVFEKWMGI